MGGGLGWAGLGGGGSWVRVGGGWGVGGCGGVGGRLCFFTHHHTSRWLCLAVCLSLARVCYTSIRRPSRIGPSAVCMRHAVRGRCGMLSHDRLSASFRLPAVRGRSDLDPFCLLCGYPGS